MKMETMYSKTCFMVDDDILNFSLDDDEEKYQTSSSSFESSNTLGFRQDDHNPSFPVSNLIDFFFHVIFFFIRMAFSRINLERGIILFGVNTRCE